MRASPSCRTAEYADDMVENAGLSREQAEQKAERDFARILPDGLETSGHTST